MALIALILNPIAIALGSIIMRSMRGLSEWTASSWTIFMQLAVTTVYVTATN